MADLNGQHDARGRADEFADAALKRVSGIQAANQALSQTSAAMGEAIQMPNVAFDGRATELIDLALVIPTGVRFVVGVLNCCKLRLVEM